VLCPVILRYGLGGGVDYSREGVGRRKNLSPSPSPFWRGEQKAGWINSGGQLVDEFDQRGVQRAALGGDLAQRDAHD
jgi:hypothetical protein